MRAQFLFLYQFEYLIVDLNLRTIYRFILVVLFLVIFVSFNRHIHSLFRPEFDVVDTCSFVVDGDTFDVSSGRARAYAQLLVRMDSSSPRFTNKLSYHKV